MAYTQYIALGDSMSIDLYPALDAGEIDVAVALEWNSGAGDKYLQPGQRLKLFVDVVEQSS